MEAKKEDSNAEKARRNTFEILKNKHPDADTQYILEAAEKLGMKLDKPLKEEYDTTFNNELKKIEQKQKESPKSEKNSEIENLRKELEQKDKTIEELTDTLKRLQAEFENYRKRVDKEKTEFAKYAHAGIIAKILPALDSFEMALKSTKIKDFRDAKNPEDFLAHTNEPQKFISGMKLIYAQLHSALEADGLRTIKTDGEKFDPYKHEVLMKEESDKPEGTILEEFQKGYMLNDKVLRFSKVKISAENKKVKE